MNSGNNGTTIGAERPASDTNPHSNQEESGRNFLKEVPPRTPPQELLIFAGIIISLREMMIPASVRVPWRGFGGTFFAKGGFPRSYCFACEAV
jgi:hypothetical protein